MKNRVTRNYATGEPRARPTNFYLWRSGDPKHVLTGFGITSKPSVDERYFMERANPPEMRRVEVLFLKLGERDARKLEKEIKVFSEGNVEYLRLPPAEVIGMVRSIITSRLPRHRKQFEAAVQS